MGAPDRRSEPDAAKREPASGQRTRVPSKTGLGSGGRAPSLRVFRGLGQASHCRGPYAAVLPSARRLCLCPGRCPTSESSSLSSTLCAPHETHLLPLVFPSSLFFTAFLSKAGSSKWGLWTLEGRSSLVVGCLVHCSVWSSIFGLYSLDACNDSSTHSVKPKKSLDLSLGENP